jgi:hypothetical protein
MSQPKSQVLGVISRGIQQIPWCNQKDWDSRILQKVYINIDAWCHCSLLPIYVVRILNSEVNVICNIWMVWPQSKYDHIWLCELFELQFLLTAPQHLAKHAVVQIFDFVCSGLNNATSDCGSKSFAVSYHWHCHTSKWFGMADHGGYNIYLNLFNMLKDS